MGRVRRSDVVARMGGDEFVVILVGVETGPEAIATAESIRDVVAEPIEADSDSISITMSIGVALKGTGDDATSLLARADEAMYEAKNTGRDSVALARPIPD